jgi:hypothetical protein
MILKKCIEELLINSLVLPTVQINLDNLAIVDGEEQASITTW